MAVLALASAWAAACTFPTVEYEPPCSGGSMCSDPGEDCVRDARQVLQTCQAECKPSDPPDCRTKCGAAAETTRDGCVTQCVSCALSVADCHNASAACEASVPQL
jgi:hypothetical protein